MAREEGLDWLVQLHEEQGSTLHRLAVLLGAESQSDASSAVRCSPSTAAPTG